MKLVVFNGSPRKENSSTRIMLDHFLEGFASLEGNEYTSFYLRSVKERNEHIRLLVNAEYVILGFPLYTDAMPALVKEFIESLGPFCGRLTNLSIGYLVQSGFPEAHHSRYVERYLKKLTHRLGARYLGTIIRGNGNRIDEQPGFRVKPVLENLFKLGKIFGQTGEFDPGIMARLARPEKLTGLTLFLTRILIHTRLSTKFWDKQLKANGAFEKRFDRPFLLPDAHDGMPGKQ